MKETMKTNLEVRIEAAAARFKALGNQALKHPVSSILSLCVLAGVAATAITFSQEQGLSLPAENVELVDVNGRKITVTVLNMAADKQSIVIRMADGREMPLLMNRLNADTITKLTGEAEVPAEKTSLDQLSWRERKNLIRSTALQANDILTELKDLPAHELHKMYVERNPKLEIVFKSNELLWESSLKPYYSTPEIKNNLINPMSIIPLMEVKTPEVDEHVSLRPDFEQLGVRAAQQVGDTCSTYSAQHLFQYAFLAAGLKPPSITTILNLTYADGKVPVPHLIQAAHKFTKQLGSPKTLKALHLHGITGVMIDEIVKHQIRNKRAVVGGHPGNPHAIVIVGFHTKGGKTTWEYLDSNRVWQDKGYKTMHGIDPMGTNYFSVWFE